METKMVDCWICNGTGIVGYRAETCPACGGHKKVEATCHGQTGMTLGEIDREIAQIEHGLDECGDEMDTQEVTECEKRIEVLLAMRDTGLPESQVPQVIAVI